MLRVLSLATLAGVLLSAVQFTNAKGRELRIIAATPTTDVVREAISAFERRGDYKVVAKYVSGPIVEKEINGGEPFDVAISITSVVQALHKAGKISAPVDVGYAPVGVGVRAGAPKPDISSE